MSEHFELTDNNDQTYVFDGYCIAVARSKTNAAGRWHEVRVYRTTGGQYVVNKIGRSIAVGETDRHSVIVCTRPEGVRATLMRKDRTGVKFMTHVSMQVWRQCLRNDESLSDCGKLAVA